MQVIVNGLGSIYRPFVRSLENWLDAVSFDDLYGLLLSEEENLIMDTLGKDTVTPTTFMDNHSISFGSRSPMSYRG